MTDFIKRIEKEIAFNKMGRGKGTGPISRILSIVQLIVFVYIVIFLFKDKQYLPFIILLLLGVTKFGHWVLIGLLIYFISTQYWTGVSLVLLSQGIGFLSVWFGLRNIKKNQFSGKADIDPFEGMDDIIITLIFQLIFLVLALLTSNTLSIIFWILFGLLTVYESGRFYHRLSSPWRRLHFPLMVHYLSIAGSLLAIQEITGKEFDIQIALRTLVNKAYPYMENDEVNSILESAKKKMTNFNDKEELKLLIQRKRNILDQNNLNDLLNKIETTLMSPKNNAMFVKYVIAEIIGRDYGKQERLNYIYAVLTGQAN